MCCRSNLSPVSNLFRSSTGSLAAPRMLASQANPLWKMLQLPTSLQCPSPMPSQVRQELAVAMLGLELRYHSFLAHAFALHCLLFTPHPVWVKEELAVAMLGLELRYYSSQRMNLPCTACCLRLVLSRYAQALADVSKGLSKLWHYTELKHRRNNAFWHLADARSQLHLVLYDMAVLVGL